MKLNTEIPVAGNVLEINIAYAYIGSDPSMSFQVESEKSIGVVGKKKKIDFVKQRNIAGLYMLFTESAFLIECTAINGETFYHTLFAKISDNELQSSPLYGGSKKFYKVLKKAKQKGENVLLLKQYKKRKLKFPFT